MPWDDEGDVGSHDEPQNGHGDDVPWKDDETYLGHVPHGLRYAHEHGLDDDDENGNGQDASNGNENGTNAPPTDDHESYVVDDVNAIWLKMFLLNIMKHQK